MRTPLAMIEVIKRLGGGVWGKAAVYELLPLAAAGDPVVAGAG